LVALLTYKSNGIFKKTIKKSEKVEIWLNINSFCHQWVVENVEIH